MIDDKEFRAAVQIALGAHGVYSKDLEDEIVLYTYKLQPEPEKDDLLRHVMRPLPEQARKALDVFAEVCNEEVPTGIGMEYMQGMMKMKAFMAGRLFQEQVKGNDA